MRFTSLIFLKLILSRINNSCSTAINSDPVAETEFGKVRGTIRIAFGASRPVYSYFGVKYGRSPDYLFRFIPPENPWKWEDIRNATDENRPMCVQDKERYEGLRKHSFFKHMMPENPNMSEDCLLLDIYTPASPNDQKVALPVIVWIHGGSFDAFCSSTKLWGLPAFEDVVLVQIQYRLGLFGFFTTNDEHALPNIAFHDQIKALRWIKRNIRSFGGDPDSVTLMGESAGSIAVTSLMLMPESSGLFHRAIALSGAPDSMKWAKSYLDTARRLGESAKCISELNAAMDMCLQNKLTTSKIMDLAKESGSVFRLSEDRYLLPDSVRVLIDKQKFANPVPVIMSVTGGETNYILSRKVFAEIYTKGPLATRKELFAALQKHLMTFYPGETIEDIISAIEDEYFGSESMLGSDMSQFYGFLQAVADSWFTSKAAKFAEKLKASGQDTFFMEFNVKPSMYDTRPEEYPRLYNFTSADHADDLLYIFGFPFVAEYIKGDNPPMSFTQEERDISRNYMQIIAHFAKTGLPPESLSWPQYPGYLEFGKTFKIHNHPYKERQMHLWNDIVNNIAFAHLQ